MVQYKNKTLIDIFNRIRVYYTFCTSTMSIALVDYVK